MKKLIAFFLMTAVLLSSVSAVAFADDTPDSNSETYWCDVIDAVENELQTAAVSELPENREAVCYTCNTCKRQMATNYERSPESDGTYGPCIYDECSGRYVNPSTCALEYYYKFKCTGCGKEVDYDSLPEGTSEAPYGVCPYCQITATEDMFSVYNRYRQYKRACFYCYKVQLGTKSVLESTHCPYCGECYEMVVPPSVDEDGKLIYGGGGSNLYYCKEAKKFYEADEDENGNVIDDCPYCDSNKTYKITVLYCTTCPSCGTIAERSHLDYYKRPYLAGTINNAFMSIFVDITGSIDPNDFDLTNTCYECKYNFTEDEDLLITRHVDAPKDAEYESHPNDRDYHETQHYLENGSIYDSFFEKIIYLFKYYSYMFKQTIEFFTNPENW